MPDQNNQTLPEILTAGISLWDPVWSRIEHTSWCGELVHVLKGTVKCHIDGITYPARAGDTLFIPSGCRHRDEFDGAAQPEILHVQFHWDAAQFLPTAADNTVLLSFSSRAKRRVARKMRELYESFAREGALARELTRALTHALLLELKSLACGAHTPPERAATSRPRHEELLALAREYIERHLDGPVTLADIAGHLGLSAYHVSHVFSTMSGFTLSSFITQRRMERAREMLADPRVRVSETAYAVGYSDPNHFTKTFRRYFGRSPSEMRVTRSAKPDS